MAKHGKQITILDYHDARGGHYFKHIWEMGDDDDTLPFFIISFHHSCDLLRSS